MSATFKTAREAGGLPPRRDQIAANDTSAEPAQRSWGDSINVPLARDRMLEYFEREQLPGDVKSTLAAALNGDLYFQHLLFNAMLDTWPKLQKAIAEVSRKAVISQWKIIPHAKRGTSPLPSSEAIAKDVEEMIWHMKPKVERFELGLEGLIESLARAYFYGHGVLEIRWHRANDGTWQPRACKDVPARYYGYSTDASTEDRLMFDPTGAMGARKFEDFAENRFLVAIRSGHNGHPSVAAPLRALAGYWLAAVYGLKWFLNFTQLYGIPWRHAEIADLADGRAVEKAMQEIGTRGYIITKPGTKIHVLDSGTTGQNLPQLELLELADKQCDQFILGQTLTSGVDASGGSRALGDVHADIRDDVVSGVADFCGGIITHQLIPAIIRLNWGDTEELPEFWAKTEKTKDSKASAERMEIVVRIGVPMSKQYVYEELGIPMPEAGAELFQPSQNVSPIATTNKMIGIQAADASTEKLTVDELADAVLEGLTGVTKEWLTPVRPFFERLAALAMSNKVSDDDFLQALEKAQKQLPELFDLLDTQALEDAFESAISSAALAGSVSRYEK